MKAQPGTAGDPDTMVGSVDGCGSPPDIRIMVQHPSRAIVMLPCGGFSSFSTLFHHLKESFMTLGKSGDFRRPIVHFSVDVDRPFAVPRRSELFVPDPLQVGGLRSRPAGGDQQVTAILDVKGQQLGIVCRFAEIDDTLVGGQQRLTVGAKTHVETVEQAGIVGQVPAQEGFEFLRTGRLQLLAGYLFRITAHITVRNIIGGGGKNQGGRLGSGNEKPVFADFRGAVSDNPDEGDPRRAPSFT